VRVRTVLLLLSLATLTPACKDKAREAAVLSAQTSLETARATLVTHEKKLDELEARCKALPKELPTVARAETVLQKMRATATTSRGALGELEAKLAAAEKSGDTAAIQAAQKDLDAFGDRFKGTDDMLPKVVKSLDAAAAEAERKQQPFASTLSTGFRVNAPGDGFENHLCDYLDGKSKTGDLEARFAFDRLVYDEAAGKLDVTASDAQLTNAAEILRAYPKIGTAEVGCFVPKSGGRDADEARGAACGRDLVTELQRRGAKNVRLTRTPTVAVTSLVPGKTPTFSADLRVVVGHTGR
jgi:hypothetical protein